MKKLASLILFPAIALAAESPCDYDHRITGSYTKRIDRVLDISRSVFPETDSVKTCRVSMTVVIDGNEYDTQGKFSFSADMSENTACGHAEQRAKENVIRRVSPEMLSANTTMDCRTKNNQQTRVAQNQRTRNDFIPNPQYPYPQYVDPNYQMPQVIYQYHQEPVIIYQHHQPPGLTPLDLFKLGISILPFVGR
jgi:hypothetical protein